MAHEQKQAQPCEKDRERGRDEEREGGFCGEVVSELIVLVLVIAIVVVVVVVSMLLLLLKRRRERERERVRHLCLGACAAPLHRGGAGGLTWTVPPGEPSQLPRRCLRPHVRCLLRKVARQ